MPLPLSVGSDRPLRAVFWPGGREVGMLNDLLRWASVATTAAVVGLLVFLPSVASACAVCTAGRDEENAFAFLMTTIFMSLMPLIAVGTLIFVLWRRIQKLETEREEAAASGAPAQSEAR